MVGSGALLGSAAAPWPQAVEIYEKIGTPALGSYLINEAWRELGAAQVAQGRFADALTTYNAMRGQLGDEAMFRRQTDGDPDFALALVKLTESGEKT